ncbi:hypothetical protein MM300_05425 [Evansella sp. LMS18]|uniref:hypothetical protein n=1 Tax=Evansella sp. LMS18 TaxID=2924033 RepID=UPI0020D00C0A|nr:hypothetical protein [Evansella sp. LMS18]UTR11743.1 hypothetical protein MM300_05425 [Evansella sp. LMS18]
MTDLDLLKIIIHRLAKIEGEMIKRNDLEEIIVQLLTQEEKVEIIQDLVESLRHSVEAKHLENINSDELLLRSIRDY